jgi:hypothetical protein
VSLWFDEISIARNLTERSLGVLLTRPLGYTQIAPVGFMAAEKLATLLIGTSDLALRTFPFLWGIAALLLFPRVAARIVDGAALTVSVALFAFAPPLVRYSTEVKQYGADVVVALVLLALTWDVRKQPTTRRCAVTGALGFVFIWFSQASVLVMGGLCGALVVLWLLDRNADTRRPALITVPMWALAAAVGVVVARQYTTVETITFMRWFWGTRHAFMPMPPRATTAALWAWGQLLELFTDPWMLRYPWPAFYAALAIFGFGVLWHQRRDAALMVGGPFLVVILAAAAQLYPFRTRVVLFLLPSVLMTLACGIAWVGDRVAATHSLARLVAVTALIAPPLSAIVSTAPPYVVAPYKPMLAYFRAHRRAADSVYVFTNTADAAHYYGPRYGLVQGTYYVGICEREDSRRYVADVDRYRGVTRLWVLSSAVLPYEAPRRSISRYLSTIGVRSDSIVLASFGEGPVKAELFNLADSARLRSVSAPTFPVDAIPDTLRPGCRK